MQLFVLLLSIEAKNNGDVALSSSSFKELEKELEKSLESIIQIAKVQPDLSKEFENLFFIPFVKNFTQNFKSQEIFIFIHKKVENSLFTETLIQIESISGDIMKEYISQKPENLFNRLSKKTEEIKKTAQIKSIIENEAEKSPRKTHTQKIEEFVRCKDELSKENRRRISQNHVRSFSVTAPKKVIPQLNEKVVYSKPIFKTSKNERKSLKFDESRARMSGFKKTSMKEGVVFNIQKMNSQQIDDFVKKNLQQGLNQASSSKLDMYRNKNLNESLVNLSFKKDDLKNGLLDQSVLDGNDYNQIFGRSFFE